jgi:PAS domain S-box-containing protein
VNHPLRILHLEDNPDYTDLVRSLLAKEGIEADIQLVQNRADFEAAIAAGRFDIILADYLLPNFDGMQALQIARDACPETPFLLVSGTIGEQAGIESLKAGATDYVLKLWPERLVASIRRAVQETENQTERQRAEAELVRSERHFRRLTDNALDIVTMLDIKGTFLYNSASVTRSLGYRPDELAGLCAFTLIHPDDLPEVMRGFGYGLAHPEETVSLGFRMRHKDGSWRCLEAVGQNQLADPDVAGIIINSRDVTDRSAAEEALRESETQYRLIFDGNPIPMWVFDQETLVFLEVNDAAAQHYGFSRDEFLQMKVNDLRIDDESPAMVEYLHKLLTEVSQASMGYAGAWRHRKKDGSAIDVEVKWSRITYKGRPAALVMANDVTERKRIECRDAALSKLGQNLSIATTPAEAALIIKAVADELFGWDAFTLDLCSADQNALHLILGVDTNSSGGRFDISSTGSSRQPGAVERRIIEHGAELVLRGEPGDPSEETVLTRKNEAPRPASLALAPIRERGKVIGILSIQSYTANAYDHRDLSTLQMLADHCGGALERIRAEQALGSSEMLFHAVWENSADGMRLTDEGGTIIAVNEAFSRLVGMSRAELEGKSFATVLAESENPAARLESYRAAFKDRRMEKRVERNLRLRNGNEIHFEEARSFVELPGQLPLLFALFRDVAGQKRLEAQLRQSQKMEAIGQLAGGVAHDFNNILTVIHGHASLLLAAGTLNGPPARSAQQIIQAAERAAALTRQLLTFSRRQVMQPRRLDLNEIVSNMTKMLGRILGEDVALQLHYAPQPTMVQADAGMMEQVLLNLAVNSRDAMPKGGVLSIRISVLNLDPVHPAENPDARAGQFACLSVADTGCGIAPENLRRIFEPFFTTKEVGKGTGLGLATVYGIVKQHQGWIDVQSQLGEGTAFKVYLPCCSQGAELSEPTPAARDVRGGSETILVVEDETPVRELVSSLLSSYGYRILQAESGLKALEIWRGCKEKVDLVLTDLVMPDRVNGRELAERLWAERPDLKVIFTSGYSADVVGGDFVLRNGLNYLQKPYPPYKLALAVRDCLDAVN